MWNGRIWGTGNWKRFGKSFFRVELSSHLSFQILMFNCLQREMFWKSSSQRFCIHFQRPTPWGALDSMVHRWLWTPCFAVTTFFQRLGSSWPYLRSHFINIPLLWAARSLIPKPPWELGCDFWPLYQVALVLLAVYLLQEGSSYLVQLLLHLTWDGKEWHVVGKNAIQHVSISVSLPPTERYNICK